MSLSSVLNADQVFFTFLCPENCVVLHTSGPVTCSVDVEQRVCLGKLDMVVSWIRANIL